MDIVAAYEQVGTYRGAAAICNTTHKTVRRVIEARKRGEFESKARAKRAKNTDEVEALIKSRVDKTDGKITAERLLAEVRAAGYKGSDRNLRRAVREAKAALYRRRAIASGRRPGVWTPGQTLLIDWGDGGDDAPGLQVFCAVLAWSRFRFVRFATDQKQTTTLGLLAECFEELGGVPKIVLADRMACLKAGVVANVVVPSPEYVRFATHYGFRPDFCEAADPESKGLVERLVGYAKSDLIVPNAPLTSSAEANETAVIWCEEVNAKTHREICVIPAKRLVKEREALTPLPSLRLRLGRSETRKVDRLSCVRLGAARYSVPSTLIGRRVEVRVTDGRLLVIDDGGEIVAEHDVVAPGEASVKDEHYPRSRPLPPKRAIRPKTRAEIALIGLGEVAEEFLRAAAAASSPRLAYEVGEIVELIPAWGKSAVMDALSRAVRFRRYKAADIASILEAGRGVQETVEEGSVLDLRLPAVSLRPLSEYAIEAVR